MNIDSLKRNNWANTEVDGLVVDNNDPLKAGRIKVRIAGVHDGVPNEHLPWAVCGITSGRGPTGNAASLRVPMKGSRVKIRFQQGDPSNPEYVGAVLGSNALPSVFQENYPNRNGEQFPNGTHWYVDESTNDLFIHHQGTTINIDSSGNVQISCSNVDVKSKNVKWQSDSVEINSKDVTWQAESIKMVAANVTMDTPMMMNTGMHESLGLITGQDGIAIAKAGGIGEAGVVRGVLRIIEGDVIADDISLKNHHHRDSEGGITSKALP